MGNNPSNSQENIIIPQINKENFIVPKIIMNENIKNTKKNYFSLKKYLTFKTYKNYSDLMLKFNDLFISKLPKNPFNNNNIKFQKKIFLFQQIKNSYFNNLDSDLNFQKLFTTAMTIYHRIGKIYGITQNYPDSILKKIDFPLLSKYLSYNYESEDEILEIVDKIIKRTNFLVEEFPFKLYNIITIINTNSCYVYGFDNELNLNIFIEPYQKGFNNNISFIDYLYYIVFIIENILPILKKNYFFNNKINILINFNSQEPNTELITFLMTKLNNIYPLILNKIHIINYDINLLKKNKSFQESLFKIDLFQQIYFHNKNHINLLIKKIDINQIPYSFNGKGEKYEINIDEEDKNFFDNYLDYLIKCVFCNFNN